MERVMVDNWLLEEAVINLRDEPEKPGKSLSDLLMAILLWDEVCFPENQNNYWRSIRGNLADYLTPITDEEWNSLKAFYCPGGFNYEKMSGFSKFMMKMFTTMLANKKDASEAEKNMAQMISHSYDISDKKYIEPILAELK